MLEASIRGFQLPDAKADSLKAISRLSDGDNDMIELMAGNHFVTSKLVSLLKTNNPSVLYHALRCLGNIIVGSDQQSQVVIDAGILNFVGKLMAHSHVRKQVKPNRSCSCILFLPK